MAEKTIPPLAVDLAGQVAVVTGASQGLGRAMAIVLGRNGAKVACVARNVEKLQDTAREITASGGVAEVFGCDVTNKDSVQKVIDGVLEKWDRIDILVNNAGITRDTLIPRMGDDDWDQVIDTNLRGTFLFTRAATAPMMSQRYGRIVNVSSVSGLMGNPGQANYSASKAGIIGMTRTVARELAKRNITVNAVAPGFIESEMTAALGDAIQEEVKKRIPVRRIGKAEEVAEAVLFLASPNAAYITGHVLTVDGGMTA